MIAINHLSRSPRSNRSRADSDSRLQVLRGQFVRERIHIGHHVHGSERHLSLWQMGVAVIGDVQPPVDVGAVNRQAELSVILLPVRPLSWRQDVEQIVRVRKIAKPKTQVKRECLGCGQFFERSLAASIPDRCRIFSTIPITEACATFRFSRASAPSVNTGLASSLIALMAIRS